MSNVQEFVETTIVLKKDKKNELGISIAGGSDSYLVSIIFTELLENNNFWQYNAGLSY